MSAMYLTPKQKREDANAPKTWSVFNDTKDPWPGDWWHYTHFSAPAAVYNGVTEQWETAKEK